MPRSFNESAATARARAELDPATRDRITWAHEHLGVMRHAGATVVPAAVRRAGLTLGEALAGAVWPVNTGRVHRLGR